MLIGQFEAKIYEDVFQIERIGRSYSASDQRWPLAWLMAERCFKVATRWPWSSYAVLVSRLGDLADICDSLVDGDD